MNPKISVVVPVLNGGQYLAETLDSILRQSYPEWECIIIDGGSQDRSLTIGERFRHRDSRFQLKSDCDQGIYDAVFKGFGSSTGRIITWINADDFFMPGAFAAAAREMGQCDSWICGLPAVCDACGDLRYVCPGNWYPRPAISAGLFHGRFLGFIQQEGIFFTRHLLDKIPSKTIDDIRVTKLCGDFLLWVALAKHAPLVSLPLVLAVFRKHGDNRSLNAYEQYFNEIRQHGFRIPPPLVGKLARIVHQTVAVYVGRSKLRKYHAFDRKSVKLLMS